jgi:hypothetical protein
MQWAHIQKFETAAPFVRKFLNLRTIQFFASDKTVDVCTDRAVVMAQEILKGLRVDQDSTSEKLDLKIVIFSSNSRCMREVIPVEDLDVPDIGGLTISSG